MDTPLKILRIRDEVQSIEHRYDAEFDIIPGGPRVTNIEMRLVGIVESLCDIVEYQQSQIDQLKKEVSHG